MAGVPDNVMERGEAYAEVVLEGRILPMHELARMMIAYGDPDVAMQELTGLKGPGAPRVPEAVRGQLMSQRADAERTVEQTITKDMEVIKTWLAMAFYCGYQAALEERHSRTKGGRK